MTPGRAKSAKAVGRYRLVHELGQSYLGPLWAVRAEGVGGAAQLGILRLLALDGLSAETRVRLLEAAWQSMEVRGDFVSPVSDVVASDGELGVISDYSEGVTLRALANVASVRRKPVPFGVALRIVLDVLHAVAALHQSSIELGDEAVPLYGGLSADSVMVCTSGRSLVVDVAIASAASTIESIGGGAERVAYAAPEQLAAAPAADARTDVFAVGVLAWELISGRRLFIGSDKGLVQKVLTGKIPRLDEARRKGDPAVPVPVQAAVMKALERDPSRRFQTAAEFAEALAGSAGHGSASADVTEYVTMVAEGPLTRVREALQNAESGTHEAVPALSARPMRNSTAPKRPSASPRAEAVPRSVPWAKLMPAQDVQRSRAGTARTAAAASAVMAPRAPERTPPAPAAASPAPLAAASAPQPSPVTAKADPAAPGAIKRPSMTGKISLPRTPGATGRSASPKRPTLQGGWAISQAPMDELAKTRQPASGPEPAPPPAEVPAPARAQQQPMVKVGSSRAFGKNERGGASVTDTFTNPHPSPPPPAAGASRARQATMIGIPLPASPSSPDIEPNEDERTRDFTAPPSSTRATEGALEAPDAVPPLQAELPPPEATPATGSNARGPRFDARLVRPGSRAATKDRLRLEPITAMAPPESAADDPTTKGVAVSPPPDLADAATTKVVVPPAEEGAEARKLLEDDEEPTHQYNPKDLLRQVEAMGRAGESGLLRPPSGAVPAPAEEDPPAVNLAPRAEAAVAGPAPVLDVPPPVDGGWLDEPEEPPARPPPEPELDPIDELLGKAIPLAPPVPGDAAALQARPENAGAATRTTTSKLAAFPAPSAPSPAFPSPAAAPSLIPSHVPPPLIHDPRANRPVTGRHPAVPATSPARAGGAGRWLVVAGLSAVVLCASAAISLHVLRGSAAAPSPSAAATTTRVVETPPAPAAIDPALSPPLPAEPVAAAPPVAASAAAPAPETSAPPAPSTESSAAVPLPSGSAEPEPPGSAAAGVEPAAAPSSAPTEMAAPSPPARAAAPAAAKPAPAPAPRPATAAPKAPAPAKALAPAPAKRAAPAKKKTRNVPDDI